MVAPASRVVLVSIDGLRADALDRWNAPTLRRLASEGACAHLVGVAPSAASSGKITRDRLNRGGDRQGNRALYRLAVGRMGGDPATRADVERRTAHGRTKPEIIRCLKRYIARELYPILAAITSTLLPADGQVSSSKSA